MASYYLYSPWTRDARVRADVVTVAPDVSGYIDDVRVKNDQFVHKGDVLFVIDQERYRRACRCRGRDRARIDQLRAVLREHTWGGRMVPVQYFQKQCWQPAAHEVLPAAGHDVGLVASPRHRAWRRPWRSADCLAKGRARALAQLPERKGGPCVSTVSIVCGPTGHLQGWARARSTAVVATGYAGPQGCCSESAPDPLSLTLPTVLTVFWGNERIRITLLPARPSRLNAISIPSARRNVCARDRHPSASAARA